MSTQYSTDISFTASIDQQPFKLLELPPELLTLLESEDTPKMTIQTSLATENATEFAMLCVGDKKYQMRQKNTSNPIMILQPATTFPSEEDDVDRFIPQPSITTISKIGDTIELIPVSDQPTKKSKWAEKFSKTRPVKKD